MHFRRYYPTLFPCLFLAGLLCFAGGQIQAQRYPFFNLGVEQGLVQSQPSSLIQDRFGQLWIGTLGGLACYDGSRFRNFGMRDGLPSNTIKSLCLDELGNICIGTAQGLSVYDGFRFHNFRFGENGNPQDNTVSQLSCGDDDSMWCLAGQNIYHWRQGRSALLKAPHEGLRWTAIKTQHHVLWAAAYGSRYLFRYEAGRWDSLALPDNQQHYILRIKSNDKGQLIILSYLGAFLQINSGWTTLFQRQSVQDPMPLSFAQASDGSYWLGTSHGAIQIQNGQIRHFDKGNGFSDVMVDDLLRDRENNLWFAANGEGLYRFSGAAFTTINERMGLIGQQVSAIAQSQDGSTFFGSFDGGLCRYEQGRIAPIQFPKSSEVWGISSLQIRKDFLWIGTHSAGLWRYNLHDGELKHMNTPGMLSTVLMMTQDSSGIWIGDGRKVFHLQGDSVSPLDLKASVECFALIGKDSLLLSIPGGFQIYAQGKAIPYQTRSGADSAQVVCMAATGQNIWIGTTDNGLFGIERASGRITHIGKAEGLRSDFIYNMYATRDGNIWVGTGFGICHVLSPFQSPRIQFYGRNQGLTGMESNRNAVLPLADGRIWFGTTGGAQLFDPGSTLAQTQPVSLQLESVALFGEPLNDTSLFQGRITFFQIPQRLRLPYKKNSLSFSFSAITLSGNSDISYRYRLKGLNAPWSDWSKTNSVTFPALPPGDYELLVQCSADGEHPMKASLRYPFIIIAPFYKTTLFRVLMVLACMLMGIFLQLMVTAARKKQRAEHEAIRRSEQAKIRQRTAEDFHDEVGNKLTRINVLTNVLRSKTSGNADVARIIDQIQDSARQLYSGTRDILWSLQPSNDNLFQVLNRIRDLGLDLFGDTHTEFIMEELPEQWKEIPLTIDLSRNLIMIFKEALNNALKYSDASQLSIHCSLEDSFLQAKIQDNGKGFDLEKGTTGQGLLNMKARAERLGGRFEIQSQPGTGTRLEVFARVIR